MKCNRCKEEIDQVWALASHGRAYCSEQCFTGRTDDARPVSSSHDEQHALRQAISEVCVPMEVSEGHQLKLFNE